mgnify:CR=1 FL=1
MKTLAKPDIARRNALAIRIQSAREDLDVAIAEYNATVETAFAYAQTTADVYNGLIEEAKEWADSIAGQIGEYIQERSERWQEGERGQAYANWLTEYEEVSFDTADIETPDPLEWDGDDAASALEGLPEDPQ